MDVDGKLDLLWLLPIVVAVAAIVWNSRAAATALKHDENKELWNAIKAVDAKLEAGYWTADRTEKHLDMIVQNNTLQLNHIGEQLKDIKDLVATLQQPRQ